MPFLILVIVEDDNTSSRDVLLQIYLRYDYFFKEREITLIPLIMFLLASLGCRDFIMLQMCSPYFFEWRYGPS